MKSVVFPVITNDIYFCGFVSLSFGEGWGEVFAKAII
jgi:hypothetical protein